MKILQINAVNGIRSTGRTCTEMSEYFTRHGHACHTVYSVGNENCGGIAAAPVPECKYHALMSRLTGLQGYHSPIATRNTIKTIRDMKPDVVVLRNLHANYLSIVPLLRYLGKCDVPTVMVLHDCWCFTGKCTHYSSRGCVKWQTGCHHCSQLKADHKSWLFDRTKKMWRDKLRGFAGIRRLAVVGVSDWITNEARKSPFFAHASFRRVYNWIDRETFCPGDSKIKEELGIEGCRMILGVSSSWSDKKGLSDFLALAEHLHEDERIVLLGRLPSMELPDKVIAAPETSDVAQLAAYYRGADVLLQLSREETFGKVVAEALACGTPVVTNRFTANPELVTEKTGVVLEEMTVQSISQAVHKVLEAGKAHYSKACADFAADRFDKEENLAQYGELFEKMCEI
ncbi:MAG: glycosyltransferase [Oscillospiraceae bacterium]|nr:glycosyltransferase [Oscillospiraceae bacterium]